VGLEHGDPSAERYLIVLHGNFTGYGAKILAGDDVPRGHVMVASFDPASHGLLDFGVGNEDVDLAGLQPFTLPDPSQMFTAVDGWRVALPPGWHAQDEPFGSSNGQSRQVIISNLSHAAFTIAQEPMPVAAGPGVPRDAVVLIVTTATSAIAGFAPVSPPLSLGDFELSRGSDGSMVGMLLMQGSEQAYAVTIRVGHRASAVDSAALESVLETITFP
jgi:hypothetical protein